ncbi:MAG TPA: trypsin-like peptidase domain-containing protein [Pseudolabrys sp.]|nr:trypsin-like peptidase domain-containing protein [Pseudolabrys sp.]
MGTTAIFALLVGVAVATAQESPGIQHAPAQADAAPKPAHAGKPAKPAAPKVSAPATVAAKTATVVSEPAKHESFTEAPLPAGERLKIQSALLWSGDYTGSIGGEDPLVSAIKNYQKRSKSKITGVLSSTERTNLLAAAQSHEDEFGWTVVVDPATGVRIGLPMKLVPQARDTPRGTRWSAKHGEVQVETFRIKNSEIKLAAFFEQQKKELSRKIEQSALRDDSFVITGTQGLKKFSVRAYSRDGEIRGVTVLFDQMMETIVAPVTAAMVSAFSPFPERSLPFAAPTKSVEYGTGLVVSARGHIVTDRKLAAGCQVIIVDGLGDAERVAEDQDHSLALLRVYGPPKLSPLALAANPPRKGDLTLVGIPDPKEQNGAKRLTEIKARLADNNAIELRQPVPMAGFSGAAALDAQGQVLGMMEMRNFVLASTEPAAPPVRLVTAETIRSFLTGHNVAPAATGGDARSAVVRIICVRK